MGDGPRRRRAEAWDETASPLTVTYSLTEWGVELAGIIAQFEALESRDP